MNEKIKFIAIGFFIGAIIGVFASGIGIYYYSKVEIDKLNNSIRQYRIAIDKVETQLRDSIEENKRIKYDLEKLRDDYRKSGKLSNEITIILTGSRKTIDTIELDFQRLRKEIESLIDTK